MIVKIQKALLARITGTVAMSLFMMLASMIGIPKMNSPQMFSRISYQIERAYSYFTNLNLKISITTIKSYRFSM